MTERAALSCRLAKGLEKAGEYEKAREALNEFWPEKGLMPQLKGLDKEAYETALKGENTADKLIALLDISAATLKIRYHTSFRRSEKRQ